MEPNAPDLAADALEMCYILADAAHPSGVEAPDVVRDRDNRGRDVWHLAPHRCGSFDGTGQISVILDRAAGRAWIRFDLRADNGQAGSAMLPIEKREAVAYLATL
jgi:hypothetical protein